MAERTDLTELPRSTRDSTYAWDEWFDGGVWRLKHGEDFTNSVKSFRTSAGGAAKVRGKKARIRTEGNGTVLLQAVPR